MNELSADTKFETVRNLKYLQAHTRAIAGPSSGVWCWGAKNDQLSGTSKLPYAVPNLESGGVMIAAGHVRGQYSGAL